MTDTPSTSGPTEATKLYAMATTVPASRQSYLTAGKRYEVLSEDNYWFRIIDDEGYELTYQWCNCHYLDGGDWTRVEAAEPEVARPAAVSPVGGEKAGWPDGFCVEYDDADDDFTVTWPDGRYLVAHREGWLIAGQTPQSLGAEPVKISLDAILASRPAAEDIPQRIARRMGAEFVPHDYDAATDNAKSVEEELTAVWVDFLDANPDDLTSPEGLPDHALMTGEQFVERAAEVFYRLKSAPVSDGALVERVAAENARLREALEVIVQWDQQRSWTATEDNPETHWEVYDGRIAKHARAALSAATTPEAGARGEDVADAERWRAFISSERFTVMGAAGFVWEPPMVNPNRDKDNWLHFTLNIWDKHPAGNDQQGTHGRALLLAYVEHLRAALKGDA